MEEDKWRVIDTHVSSMMNWTKGLSTTPTGNLFPGSPRQGHIHRKSEPDVVMIRQAQKSRNAGAQLPVPQSAPVQPGTFTLDWNSMPSSQLPNCENELTKEEDDLLPETPFPELETFGANTTPTQSPISPPKNYPLSHKNVSPPSITSANNSDVEHPGFIGLDSPPMPPPYHRVTGNGTARNNRPFNGINEGQSIPHSPRMQGLIPVKPPINSSFGYPSPKTNRRSSMPATHIDPRAQSASPNITRRSTSIQPAMPRRGTQDNFISSGLLTSEINSGQGVIPVVSIPIYNSNSNPLIISPLSSKKPEDQEYTKALLQHQHDRMQRLQKELEAKKKLLESLSATVVIKEKEASDRRNEDITKSMPMPNDIWKLREINRQMEIECNCMIKEVDMVSSSGHHSMEGNFHDFVIKKTPSVSRRRSVVPELPSPPLPPPPDPPKVEEDDTKWSCKYCTFLNHSALDKCEVCEYRRDRAAAS